MSIVNELARDTQEDFSKAEPLFSSTKTREITDFDKCRKDFGKQADFEVTVSSVPKRNKKEQVVIACTLTFNRDRTSDEDSKQLVEFLSEVTNNDIPNKMMDAYKHWKDFE